MSTSIPTSLCAPDAGLPLIIGLCGHHDLDPQDVPTLKTLVQHFFERLQKRYPSTPLLLLCTLNEGADQLVASIAQEHRIPLVAVFPLPPAALATEPQSAAVAQELAKLRSAAACTVVLPLPAGIPVTAVETPGPARDAQYRAADAYIVRHCQILLALWDGLVCTEPGSPGERFALLKHGSAAPDAPSPNPLDPTESGIVYHILARRAGQEQVAGKLLKPRWRFPRAEDEKKTDWAADKLAWQVLANVNAYNRDAARLQPRLLGEQQSAREYCLPEGEVRALPAELQPVVRRLLSGYAIADALARFFQSRVQRVWPALFVLAYLAAYLFSVSYLHPEGHWARMAYPVVAGVGFGLYVLAWQRRWHSKHLDYRGLAEALRVQLFWRLAGLHDSAAGHYLPIHWSDLRWIRVALQNSALLAELETPGVTALPLNRWTLLTRYWVEGQRDYFDNRAIPRDRKKLRLLQTLGWLFLVLGGAWVTWRGLGGFWPGLAGPDEWVRMTWQLGPQGAAVFQYFSVLLGTWTILGALLFTYARTLGLAQHLKQFQRALQIYVRAASLLLNCVERQDDAAAQELVLRLGKEALAENAHWVLLHRERPIEVPRTM